MRTRFAVVAALLVQTPGCGASYYGWSVRGAAARLEEARAVGAETLAPFEYYYAKAHLEQAEIEASEASYGDATHFAETADEFAQKAIELSEAARSAPREGAGHE
jgi:hypothetical protein